MSYDNFDHVYLGIKLFHEGRFHAAKIPKENLKEVVGILARFRY